MGDGRSMQCICCGNDKPIDLPERLVEQCHKGDLLLFVGSGASTESHNVLRWTFYDYIRSKIGIGDDLPFPDLMTAYVNAYSRSELITEFFGRMSYIDSYRDLKKPATRFHNAVAQIPYLREIVTTNWDPYFERICGAIPLVVGGDYDYWGLPDRKVLKIHGSVLNPGSMIATRAEYDRSLELLRNGALGASLKHFLATRSVVFVGYSMRDDDISDVITALRSDLSSAARKCYFVNPRDGFEPPIDNAEVFRTSAASFVDQLDEALVASGCLLPASLYERVEDLDLRLRRARSRFDEVFHHSQYPLAIYNAFYQDGFRHVLDRTRVMRRTGDDRAHGALVGRARHYEQMRKVAGRRRRYADIAYLEGYQAGLIALGALDIPLRIVPMYYCPGVEHETSFKRIGAAVRKGHATHRLAYAQACKNVEHLPSDMFLDYPPVLPPYLFG